MTRAVAFVAACHTPPGVELRVSQPAFFFFCTLQITWKQRVPASLQGKMGTSKDADMSPFVAAAKLLSMETTRMSLIDRTELVFQDMDLVPLLIQVAPHSGIACQSTCFRPWIATGARHAAPQPSAVPPVLCFHATMEHVCGWLAVLRFVPAAKA